MAEMEAKSTCVMSGALSLAFLGPKTVEAIAAGNHRIWRPDSLAERDGFEPSYMDPAPVASRSID
jgi:hypothetical protein